MPVLPYGADGANLFKNPQDLYQFLFACKQIALEHERSQVVSLSVAVPRLDPLAVLRGASNEQRIHFYFETARLDPEYSWAIAALDTAVYLKTEGPQRFDLGREFVQTTLAESVLAGNLAQPFAGPHFFCSFTFFDHSSGCSGGFPAATLFLPRWQIATPASRMRSTVGGEAAAEATSTVVTNFVVSPDTHLPSLSQSLIQEWQGLQAAAVGTRASQPLSLPSSLRLGLKSQTVVPAGLFKASVEKALAAIAANYFHKIVLSHAIDIEAEQEIAWGDALQRLRHLNPDCYLFSTSNGQGQTFIGASPERLLKLQDSELFTDALAGSAPRGRTDIEDTAYGHHLLHSSKELREHRIVIQFIQQQLTRLGLAPQVTLAHPHLLQLANIQHLQTPIRAKVPPHIHVLEILADLHPTPAVAGMPREIACQEIRQFELFERGLYAAPLGWVDYQGNGEFIVGIRSALIQGNTARLYAGAGIVAGSDPDQELAEVNLKLQVLLKALEEESLSLIPQI